ncbi:hypothetical protein WR25_17676 [Diploscapter pachys]|uniref:C2H2-type domain-containing protein n=1 Tax=Diploscapter pachys TaxID=2018661 RepID=A0A2A2KC01_9BILA|nr:hypothetical protein WR25_17676 [Diploscapter pachys]
MKFSPWMCTHCDERRYTKDQMRSHLWVAHRQKDASMLYLDDLRKDTELRILLEEAKRKGRLTGTENGEEGEQRTVDSARRLKEVIDAVVSGEVANSAIWRLDTPSCRPIENYNDVVEKTIELIKKIRTLPLTQQIRNEDGNHLMANSSLHDNLNMFLPPQNSDINAQAGNIDVKQEIVVENVPSDSTQTPANSPTAISAVSNSTNYTPPFLLPVRVIARVHPGRQMNLSGPIPPPIIDVPSAVPPRPPNPVSTPAISSKKINGKLLYIEDRKRFLELVKRYGNSPIMEKHVEKLRDATYNSGRKATGNSFSKDSIRCKLCSEVVAPTFQKIHVLKHFSGVHVNIGFACQVHVCRYVHWNEAGVRRHISKRHAKNANRNPKRIRINQLEQKADMFFEECFDGEVQQNNNKYDQKNSDAAEVNKYPIIMRNAIPKPTPTETRSDFCYICNRNIVFVLDHFAHHMGEIYEIHRFSCLMCPFKCALQTLITEHVFVKHFNKDLFEDSISKWSRELMLTLSRMCFNDPNYIEPFLPWNIESMQNSTEKGNNQLKDLSGERKANGAEKDCGMAQELVKVEMGEENDEAKEDIPQPEKDFEQLFSVFNKHIKTENEECEVITIGD